MMAEAPGAVRDLLREIEDRLRLAGSGSPRAEAEWLMAEALGQDGLRRTELYLYEGGMTPEARERLTGWLARRLAGEPVQYVTGSAEFFGHRLEVSPAVLIPRPETEIIVEQAVAWACRRGGGPALRVLDVGAGSGNIAISLAKAIPACVVVALELSWDVLCVAHSNVARHGLDRRVLLVQADWAEFEAAHSRFDLIVSNPPYVSTAAVERLPGTVRWEPRLALDGGVDGLEPYRQLLARVPGWLAPGGLVGFECDDTHHAALCALCARQPWVRQCHPVIDLAGRWRGVFLETN